MNIAHTITDYGHCFAVQTSLGGCDCKVKGATKKSKADAIKEKTLNMKMLIDILQETIKKLEDM